MFCDQPSCDGVIEDGYCNVCGAPAGAEPLLVYNATPGDHQNSCHTWDESTSVEPSLAVLENQLHITLLGSARGGADAKRKVVHRVRNSQLGEGITVVAPAPQTDPTAALLPQAVLPENKRNCPNCTEPVGRSRDGEPGLLEGFCPNCNTKYSFTPKLERGDLVAGQYLVEGALAYGGMGWIYLARDRNVSDRWVVLKGLLNSEDPDLMQAALSEQKYLAQINHPLIVEMYNFVRHEGSVYIVMEYVGGQTLKQILKSRKEANQGEYHPFPVATALAYIIGILPAFQYLHDLGLLYCDFKPDNIILVGDTIKLIDLGSVRAIDDDESVIFGTVGFQAPEIATQGCSIASDIYTIGRTLTLLIADFKGYQSTYKYTLPSPKELPVFAQYDSLYRVIAKCCAPDPRDRFISVDELNQQLLGVLREVVYTTSTNAAQHYSASLLFTTPQRQATQPPSLLLPQLLINPSDPGFEYLANMEIADPQERLRTLANSPISSPEMNLARAFAALYIQDYANLDQIINDILTDDPWEWRAVWVLGLAAMDRQDWLSAQNHFMAIYAQIPGELAPKLALALAYEHSESWELAKHFYNICAHTDATYVSVSAFGLARIAVAQNDLPAAIQALDYIPNTSSKFHQANALKIEYTIMLAQKLDDLDNVLSDLADIALSEQSKHLYEVQLFYRAWELTKNVSHSNRRFAGKAATSKNIRNRLAASYRRLAAHLPPEEAVQLLDLANSIRTWSIL